MHSRAAVVGVGESRYFRAGGSDESALQLACTAIGNAIDDAGLTPADIDGLVTFSERAITATHLASLLGFGNLRYCAQAWSGGGNLGAATVNLADAAVCSGQATNVVAYRAVNQGRQGRFGQARSTNAADNEEAYLAPFGVGAPVIKNALLVKKFMSDFGISQESLAEISLAAYAHAQHNPRAVMYGRALTREAYHASRWIAEPFHLFDCCQENDGAAAVVVTTAERAVDLAAAAGLHPGRDLGDGADRWPVGIQRRGLSAGPVPHSRRAHLGRGRSQAEPRSTSCSSTRTSRARPLSPSLTSGSARPRA